MKTSVRVKTSHRGTGGHGLARHSGTCDWNFLEMSVVRTMGVTKAGQVFTELQCCFKYAPQWNKQVYR